MVIFESHCSSQWLFTVVTISPSITLQCSVLVSFYPSEHSEIIVLILHDSMFQWALNWKIHWWCGRQATQETSLYKWSYTTLPSPSHTPQDSGSCSSSPGSSTWPLLCCSGGCCAEYSPLCSRIKSYSQSRRAAGLEHIKTDSYEQASDTLYYCVALWNVWLYRLLWPPTHTDTSLCEILHHEKFNI